MPEGRGVRGARYPWTLGPLTQWLTDEGRVGLMEA